MKINRLIVIYKSMINKESNSTRIVELAHGLHVLQDDRIKELEREVTQLKLEKRYKKVA